VAHGLGVLPVGVGGHLSPAQGARVPKRHGGDPREGSAAVACWECRDQPTVIRSVAGGLTGRVACR
jgi:hypothetical protein